jgi:hypothetical protein
VKRQDWMIVLEALAFVTTFFAGLAVGYWICSGAGL